MNNAQAYALEFVPIRLKALATECGIHQNTLAQAAGVSRTTINLAINRGYLPATIDNFRTRIETHIRANILPPKCCRSPPRCGSRPSATTWTPKTTANGSRPDSGSSTAR